MSRITNFINLALSELEEKFGTLTDDEKKEWEDFHKIKSFPGLPVEPEIEIEEEEMTL